MKKILVIGSINTDFVIQVPSLPRAGETILGGPFSQVCGGKGANQAFACGRLGAQVEMLGAVGNDSFGETSLQNLCLAGVETGRIRRCENTGSGIAFISVERSGENSIIVAPGANQCVDIPYLQANREAFLESDLILLQLEIPLESVIFAARLARELGKTVILDPAPALPLPDMLLQQVDILKPNETELAALTGQTVASRQDAVEAAQTLLARGAGAVTATLGKAGAALVTRQGAELLDAPPVQAVDTTAAGDSFTAALAVGLAEGMPLPEAARFGVQVSSCVVTRSGAQTSIPTRAELAAFYSSDSSVSK